MTLEQAVAEVRRLELRAIVLQFLRTKAMELVGYGSPAHYLVEFEGSHELIEPDRDVVINIVCELAVGVQESCRRADDLAKTVVEVTGAGDAPPLFQNPLPEPRRNTSL